MKIDYSKAIISLRVKLNLSQQAMAAYLGVSYESVSRWERGIYEPTKLVKIKIINLLKENDIKIEDCE
jgi:DNA-binding transcriptional regulator YiaG